MCWSIPAKITEINGNIACAEIGGVSKEIVLDLIDGPSIGDYVLVHAGYAIQKVSNEKAEFTKDFLEGGNPDV